MNKKQLRQRLKDMAAGAGYRWNEEYKYFDYYEDQLVCIGKLATAIRESDIPLPKESRLYFVWAGDMHVFQDLDELTNYIWNDI